MRDDSSSWASSTLIERPNAEDVFVEFLSYSDRAAQKTSYEGA